jgi:hypothetical protein
MAAAALPSASDVGLLRGVLRLRVVVVLFGDDSAAEQVGHAPGSEAREVFIGAALLDGRFGLLHAAFDLIDGSVSLQNLLIELRGFDFGDHLPGLHAIADIDVALCGCSRWRGPVWELRSRPECFPEGRAGCCPAERVTRLTLTTGRVAPLSFVSAARTASRRCRGRKPTKKPTTISAASSRAISTRLTVEGRRFAWSPKRADVSALQLPLQCFNF